MSTRNTMAVVKAGRNAFLVCVIFNPSSFDDNDEADEFTQTHIVDILSTHKTLEKARTAMGEYRDNRDGSFGKQHPFYFFSHIRANEFYYLSQLPPYVKQTDECGVPIEWDERDRLGFSKGKV